MNSKKTLCISKTICWHCKKEYKAAYAIWERGEKRCICSPECFSEKDKAVAAENGVIIKLVEHKEKEIIMHNNEEGATNGNHKLYI